MSDSKGTGSRSMRIWLRNRLNAFGRDDRGSVTIQVIFFSLMVFGATGIVLDAGRVYDTHSRIQIYADNMAYMAASELDRKDNSIERATDAVFSNLLLGADSSAGYYTVTDLKFYDGMQPSNALQNNLTEAFPDAPLATTTSFGGGASIAANTQSSATHVVVSVAANISAVTRFVTQTIPDIGYDNPVNASAKNRAKQIGPDSYDLAVVSAATLNRESCAKLTTLVMCNPWEDQTGSANALEASIADPDNTTVPGRSLMYFAPNLQQSGVPSDQIVTNGEDHGSLFPWNINHQLFQIDGANTDPGLLCSGDFLRNLAGTVIAGGASTQEYLDARDRCLMARAAAPEVCWSDDDPLAIRPASGDTVLRSVNTIFDIWNEPFDSIIEAGSSVTPTGASPVTAAQFFEPDRLAITTYETADRFGVPDPANPRGQCNHTPNPDFDSNLPTSASNLEFINLPDDRLVQDGIPDYNLPWPCDDPNTAIDETDPVNASPDSFQPAYDTIPQPGWTYLAGTRGEGVGYDFCHDKTLGRQDTARQVRTQCLIDSEVAADPDAARLQCQQDYVIATSFDGCAASAIPGREREECGCEIDFVGDHHEGGQPLYMFARTLGFRNHIYDFDNVGQANAVLPLSPFSTEIMTWYQFYQKQRQIQLLPTDQATDGDRSRVAMWNGAAPASPDDPQDAVQDYALATGPSGVHSELRQGYVKNYPDDFLALSGQAPSGGGGVGFDPSAVLLNEGRERRRIRAAMVNCNVVTGLVPDSNGDTRVANGGTYDVTLDDMRIMDAYIPNPAGIFCGPDTVACDIPDSVETSMYIELIEDVTEGVTSDIFTVQLVR